jgi:hypothetical protein
MALEPAGKTDGPSRPERIRHDNVVTVKLSDIHRAQQAPVSLFVYN